MSENSPFPANQKFQPPINACPNTDYNHSFFLPQSTAGSTREGFEHPPQKRPRLSNPIQNSPQNFFPNTMMHPPNPMMRNPPPVNPSQNTKGIFFKTKLCTGFRQGRCIDANKCDYAHGMEELRKPPPGWQEMARNEQHTKPCRHIYKSLCSYGDACTFSHIDPPSYGGEVGMMQLRDQEVKQMRENSNKNLNATGNQKLASYKTRLCHAYERNGTCPKGDQCQFAHGDAELRSYGGYNEVDTRSNVDATTLSNPCPAPASDASPAKTHPPACVLQQTEDEDHKTPYEWRGPTKLSLIYGDWIYDPS